MGKDCNRLTIVLCKNNSELPSLLIRFCKLLIINHFVIHAISRCKTGRFAS